MDTKRRVYKLTKSIKVNNVSVKKIIIDPHVDKHSDHITDALIKDLVLMLDEKEFQPAKQDNEFSYYVNFLKCKGRNYRLVWLQQDNYFYIGVLTAFKDKGVE